MGPRAGGIRRSGRWRGGAGECEGSGGEHARDAGGVFSFFFFSARIGPSHSSVLLGDGIFARPPFFYDRPFPYFIIAFRLENWNFRLNP
jgi:hypothetical protein